MLKRLGSITALSVSLSLSAALLEAPPASAASCGLVQSVTSSCPQPAPQQSQPQQSQPQQAQQSQPQQSQERGPGYIGEVPDGAGRLLALVNHERTSRGMRALQGRGDIASIAGSHTASMAGHRTIWHNDSYFTANTRSSLRAKALGENVGMAGSVDAAHRALMDSAGHRANILNASFDVAGFSVMHDERGYVYVTENFATSGEEARATPAKGKAKVAGAKKAKAGRAKATVRRSR